MNQSKPNKTSIYTPKMELYISLIHTRILYARFILSEFPIPTFICPLQLTLFICLHLSFQLKFILKIPH